ncbi:TIGR00282 family metallophosphoesterase [Deferribacter autotrophicus]|uniref:TIGR00282 family metallophosphoesterase n=1 Tax=Deferribacter autotrophicus TaxID=500465 RepID=A0A5A8F0X5_9BACT|nr:TIGR00282 family metallophosphoesterase [Deferribacter autotrophicus]KAA0257006.1 TIGR00282 family metallophosphoesterase [Deferribacter autotrophicus]
MNILFIGDLIGRAGRKVVSALLDSIKYEYGIDLVIANGENSAGGFGINEKIYKELRNKGIDIITTGNHIWDKKETANQLDEMEYLIRPANYPEGVPGAGFITVTVGDMEITVINLMGRVFMPLSDCPFRVFDEIYDKVSKTVVLVDFHAEATSEKNAFGLYVDGRAAAVIGTHTHVQTNDDRLLPKGTFYISDVGMCGALDSVIGMEKNAPINRFLTGIPSKFEVEKKGKMVFNAVVFYIDKDTKKVRDFKKIFKVIEG